MHAQPSDRSATERPITDIRRKSTFPAADSAKGRQSRPLIDRKVGCFHDLIRDNGVRSCMQRECEHDRSVSQTFRDGVADYDGRAVVLADRRLRLTRSDGADPLFGMVPSAQLAPGRWFASRRRS